MTVKELKKLLEDVDDEKGLYEAWLYCCPGKEYLKTFEQTTKYKQIKR